jgi:hypothetical protein
MRNLGNRASRILAGRGTSQKDRDAKATAYEAATIGAQLRAGQPPLCTHDWTRDLPRDGTVDRNAAQEEGQRRCRAAQIAAIAADPPTTAPAPSTGP